MERSIVQQISNSDASNKIKKHNTTKFWVIITMVNNLFKLFELKKKI